MLVSNLYCPTPEHHRRLDRSSTPHSYDMEPSNVVAAKACRFWNHEFRCFGRHCRSLPLHHSRGAQSLHRHIIRYRKDGPRRRPGDPARNGRRQPPIDEGTMDEGDWRVQRRRRGSERSRHGRQVPQAVVSEGWNQVQARQIQQGGATRRCQCLASCSHSGWFRLRRGVVREAT